VLPEAAEKGMQYRWRINTYSNEVNGPLLTALDTLCMRLVHHLPFDWVPEVTLGYGAQDEGFFAKNGSAGEGGRTDALGVSSWRCGERIRERQHQWVPFDPRSRSGTWVLPRIGGGNGPVH